MVVTWGSQGGAPYVTGVPVGRVTQVFSSLRQTSQRAVIEPFVDFGALDVVGVVVPSGTHVGPVRRRGRREAAMTQHAARSAGWSRPASWSWLASPVLRSPLVPARRRGRAWCPTSACSSWSRPRWCAGRSRRPSSASSPACCSTWRRRPTTWPAAGRWRWSWSATSPAGCVRTPAPRAVQPTAVAVVATVAASSFVGTSIYAITGLVLQDPAVSIGDLLPRDRGRGLLGRAAGAARAAGADARVHAASSRPGHSRREGDAMRSERGRLRVLVIQVLVFSLFATLFARLYYLQVVSGETYHARAASQSLRDIVVQPERGLIVDDQGRPLVANRTSWVVAVDRTLLGKLGRARVERGREAAGPRCSTCNPPGSARSCCRAVTRAARSASAGTGRRTSPCRSPPTSTRTSPCGSSSSPRTTRP